MRGAALLVPLLLIAACDSPSHSAARTAPPVTAAGSPSAAPTDTPGRLDAYLDAAADAEESWLQDHPDYTAVVGDLTTQGLRRPAGFHLSARAFGSDSYCLVATAPDRTRRSYVSKLDEDHVLGYLYDGDVCTGHVAGQAYPSPSASPSPQGQDLVDAVLTDAADAEESLFFDTNRYSTDLGVLAARGYAPVPGITVTPHLEGPDAYCLDGTGRGVTRHYDSSRAAVGAGPCPRG